MNKVARSEYWRIYPKRGRDPVSRKFAAFQSRNGSYRSFICNYIHIETFVPCTLGNLP